MTKTVSTSPTSSRSSGWWGSPISILLGIVLGGVGGGSVYWLAERSRANDAVPGADASIMTVSAVQEPATAPPPAAAPFNAPAEPPPAAAETPAEPEAEDEPELAQANEADEDEDEDEDDAPAAAASLAKPSRRGAETKTAEPVAAQDTQDDEKPSAARKADASGEKAMLQSARAKVRTGDTFGAQVVLEQMRKRYPDGELAQQRELLYIKTQKALGALAAAKRSARAFAQAYPNSPYLGSLESLLLEP